MKRTLSVGNDASKKTSTNFTALLDDTNTDLQTTLLSNGIAKSVLETHGPNNAEDQTAEATITQQLIVHLSECIEANKEYDHLQKGFDGLGLTSYLKSRSNSSIPSVVARGTVRLVHAKRSMN